MTPPRPKQVILAAYFPGVNNTTVWTDPRAGSQIAFDSFEHLARTAERGKLDFFFLAEGLRLREQGGRIHDLDVVGRPDTLTVLAALAAVTTHLGLAGTLNATFREPVELARQLASLDHLSGGRSAWNVVTSSDAFTGENFRRGGFLLYEDRYRRAGEFLDVARALWDSWTEGDVVADREGGRFLARSDAGRFSHRGPQFDVHGRFNVPRMPQGHPVVLQAGDSDGGRELAASRADAVFSRHAGYEGARAFYEDVKGRLARYGRRRDELKILPAVSYVLGDSEADAQERATEIRRQQVTPQTARLFAEQLWNRDLSSYDMDGPLPALEPDLESTSISQGRTRTFPDPVRTVREWRELAAARGLSTREVVMHTMNRLTFVGTAAQVAERMVRHVHTDACDGFVLSPHLTPAGLDDFVEHVVPLLQERGVLRDEYRTTTLREHLGLPAARSLGRPVATPAG